MDRDDRILAYIQGRLTPEERDALESEAADDPQLSAELAAMSAVRTAMAEHDAPDKAEGWAALAGAMNANQPEAANSNQRPLFWSVAQAAGIAVAAVLLWEVVAKPQIGEENAHYLPAGTEAGYELQVLFAADAGMAEVTAFLADIDGVIVNGPGAIGIYHISFTDDAARLAARTALAERPDLIAEILAD